MAAGYWSLWYCCAVSCWLRFKTVRANRWIRHRNSKRIVAFADQVPKTVCNFSFTYHCSGEVGKAFCCKLDHFLQTQQGGDERFDRWRSASTLTLPRLSMRINRPLNVAVGQSGEGGKEHNVPAVALPHWSRLQGCPCAASAWPSAPQHHQPPGRWGTHKIQWAIALDDDAQF